MTERQDLRPLSTEDLLPDHDRTHADDRDSTDTTDRYRTNTDVDRDRPDTTDTADRHDIDADANRSVVPDQYDEQPAALGETGAAQDRTTPDDAFVQQRPAQSTTRQEGTAPLFANEEVDRFRTEWRGLQSDFVDSPRDAVRHADQLVAQVMRNLATTFADRKKSLEGQWSKGEQVETEELRLALRQYRAFFDKLLTV